VEGKKHCTERSVGVWRTDQFPTAEAIVKKT
jgi:hypothetical protein